MLLCCCCVVCFHSRLTGSLVSGEGALKRFKFAVPKHRLRVYPKENPQPRKRPRAQVTRQQGRHTARKLRSRKTDRFASLAQSLPQSEGATNAVIHLKQTGIPPGVWDHAPPRSVGLCGVVSAVASCPQLSNTVAGTEQTVVMSSITGVGKTFTISTTSSTIEEQQRQQGV